MNTFIRSLAAAALVAAAVSPAAAQTAPSTANRNATNVAVPGSNATTSLESGSAGSLNNWYAIKPLIPQCGDQPVVGPMPAAQAGSVQSQPLYTWLIDPDMVGLACRKAL